MKIRLLACVWFALSSTLSMGQGEPLPTFATIDIQEPNCSRDCQTLSLIDNKSPFAAKDIQDRLKGRKDIHLIVFDGNKSPSLGLDNTATSTVELYEGKGSPSENVLPINKAPIPANLGEASANVVDAITSSGSTKKGAWSVTAIVRGSLSSGSQASVAVYADQPIEHIVGSSVIVFLRNYLSQKFNFGITAWQMAGGLFSLDGAPPSSIPLLYALKYTKRFIWASSWALGMAVFDRYFGVNAVVAWKVIAAKITLDTSIDVVVGAGYAEYLDKVVKEANTIQDERTEYRKKLADSRNFTVAVTGMLLSTAYRMIDRFASPSVKITAKVLTVMYGAVGGYIYFKHVFDPAAFKEETKKIFSGFWKGCNDNVFLGAMKSIGL